MRRSKWIAGVVAALVLGGCEENSLPPGAVEVANSRDGGSAQETPPREENPPPDRSPPPDQGDESPPPSDPPPDPSDEVFTLPSAAVSEFRYAGANDNRVEYTAAVSRRSAADVVSPDDLWVDCLSVRFDRRPERCRMHTLNASWSGIERQIDRMDAAEYSDRNVFEAWSDRDSADGGTRYGQQLLRTQIHDLPSTIRAARVSHLLTAVIRWEGYPSYVTIEAGLPEGLLQLDRGAMEAGTLIQIYGRENADDDDDEDEGAPLRLLAEERLAETGRYDFELPAASPYWSMREPVRFTTVVTHWVTVTRRPRGD